jgi:hypothetical protein
MFKQITSGFTKFFTKERILVLIIFLVIVWALLSYSGSKLNLQDNMDVGTNGPALAPKAPATSAPAATAAVAPTGSGYALQPVANPSELLPKDQNSQWAALNPNTMNQGDVLMPDLLQAGYHIGLDTIGQTLRNANLQLRSDPIISKADVGPWHQSTIEPDMARVPLEIGQGPR